MGNAQAPQLEAVMRLYAKPDRRNLPTFIVLNLGTKTSRTTSIVRNKTSGQANLVPGG